MGGVAALPTNEEPEYLVAGAIIRAAIVEAIKGQMYQSKVTAISRKSRAELSRDWFFSVAFAEICHTFEANPDAIRSVALEVIDRNRTTPSRQVRWREGPRVRQRGNDWGICPECGGEYASLRAHQKGYCDGGEWEFTGEDRG